MTSTHIVVAWFSGNMPMGRPSLVNTGALSGRGGNSAGLSGMAGRAVSRGRLVCERLASLREEEEL